MIRIRRGLDLPISGGPEQKVEPGPAVGRVALLGDDYVGLRPTLAVQLGDPVKLGQLLFTDKKNPGVRFTSPGCGEVVEINRGAKRRFESIVIRLEGDEEESFPSLESSDPGAIDRETVLDGLVNSGLWTALRTRPYGNVPAPDAVPQALFVTAIDTRPLAPDPVAVLRGREEDFVRGLRVVARLTDGPVHLCRRPGAEIPGGDLKQVHVHEFGGPHPAGLPGTHIHFVNPVNDKKSVWYIGYQDVTALGHLFLTGRLDVNRIVALAGPAVERPRLLKTRAGASIDDLTRHQLKNDKVRLISGSVLAGRTASATHAFLGRYHNQVSAISDRRRRRFLGWIAPGWDRFSVKPTYASALLGMRRPVPFTTSAEGDPRAIVPVGIYEKVMPLDILPTPLLKALVVGDTEQAQALGCLELVEEDLALCSFVCPGKHDFGASLRNVLTNIEKEG
jgi:Na+-transporting NADH:ubiquinone oxidoreductase subunit A